MMENLTSRILHERFMVFAPSHIIWTPKCSDVVRKAITVKLCVQEVKGIEDLGRDFTVQIFERTVLFILLTVRIMGD
jgi:hypothetical protein